MIPAIVPSEMREARTIIQQTDEEVQVSDTTDGMWPSPQAPVEEWIEWATTWRSVAALNMVCVGFGERTVDFTVDAVPFPANPNGAINGGMLAAIADQVFGVLAMWGSPTFVPATANLQVEYHRPLIGPASIRGEILPGGRRLQFLEAILSDESGRRCATAHATMVAVTERPDLAEARGSHDN